MEKDVRVDEWESRLLVGRNREIQTFLQMLDAKMLPQKIICLYGTAGVGKSYLLDEFQRQTLSRNITSITLDSASFWHSPQAFCLQIFHSLHIYDYDHESNPSLIQEMCIRKINELTMKERLVLFVDTYENMESMDHWLREYFFKKLSNNVLIVIAGRYSLSESWFLSPGWRQLITRMPLSHLNLEDVELYSKHCHIFDSSLVQQIWSRSQGHPLTLSLLSFTMQQQEIPRIDEANSDELDTLPFIVSQWMREVPGEHLRPLVEGASVLRLFNQDNLSYIMGKEITAAEFYQLIRFSFVRKVEGGWTIHSLMREAVTKELRFRTPKQYELLQTNAIHFYYEKIKQNPSHLVKHEAYELMYFIGDELIRAFINWFDEQPRIFEIVGREHREELLAFIEKRYKEATDKVIKLFDPKTNHHFQFYLTAEQTLYSLKWLDIDKLFSLEYDVVRVLRNSNREIVAFAIIVPINEKTLPYLLENPVSKTYFSNLPAEQLQRFAVSENTRAGWYIDTIDQLDYEDVSEHTAIGHLLHSLMFTGEFLMRSPAPFPFFKAAHESLGFEIAEFATHYHYDGVTPTPTFVRETQDEHLLAYLTKLPTRNGLGNIIKLEEKAPPPDQSTLNQQSQVLEQSNLTPREKDVASLLLEGLTNVEIASRLYLSEVTVKKHFKSIFEKLEVSNRTQLVKKLLEK